MLRVVVVLLCVRPVRSQQYGLLQLVRWASVHQPVNRRQFVQHRSIDFVVRSDKFHPSVIQDLKMSERAPTRHNPEEKNFDLVVTHIPPNRQQQEQQAQQQEPRTTTKDDEDLLNECKDKFRPLHYPNFIRCGPSRSWSSSHTSLHRSQSQSPIHHQNPKTKATTTDTSFFSQFSNKNSNNHKTITFTKAIMSSPPPEQAQIKQYGPPGTTPGGKWFLYEKAKPSIVEHLCCYFVTCQCIFCCMYCCGTPGSDKSTFAYRDPQNHDLFTGTTGSLLPAKYCQNEVSSEQLDELLSQYHPSYKKKNVNQNMERN